MAIYPELGPVLRGVPPYPGSQIWGNREPTLVTSFRLPVVAQISPLEPLEVVASPVEPVEALASSGAIMIMPKTPIPNSAYFLGQAVVLQLEASRDGVVLRSEFLDEESYGATLNEACFDFLTSLRDRRQSLERREHLLSTGDRVILERLRRVLESPPR